MNLIITPRAEADINGIAFYIARESGSGDKAYQFAEKLRDKCKHLASLPFAIGIKRNELLPGLYSYAYGNYLIFYECTEEVMRVISIIEGHRDVDAIFE